MPGPAETDPPPHVAFVDGLPVRLSRPYYLSFLGPHPRRHASWAGRSPQSEPPRPLGYCRGVDTEAWDRIASTTERTLRQWSPTDPDHARLRDDAVERLTGLGGDFVRKGGAPEHITASCFVLSGDRRSILLALHKKAGRWLQLGGHLEAGDADPAAAALREAREEGGLPGVRLLSARPVDIDAHRLIGSFGACRTHWDLGFLGVASQAEPVVVSDESDEVAWWPLAELPQTQPHLAARVATAVRGIPARGVPTR